MRVSANIVSKKFGDKVLFQDFKLDIASGDFVAVVGKSGCGKTTLLNMIGLVDSDFDGEIVYDGVPVVQTKMRRMLLREDVSYIFQNYGLIDHETVAYNLSVILKLKNMKRDERKRVMNRVLDEVGLSGFLNKHIYELSGGEQQRVALSKILIKMPKVIIADEPTASLDSESEKEVMQLLLKLHASGCTIIVVTHNENVAKYAKRIVKIG